MLINSLGSISILRRLFFRIYSLKSSVSLRFLSSQNRFILNFHKVGFDEFTSGYPGISVENFERLIIWAKDNFELASINEDFHASGPSKRPRMVISFDDGYYSFIEKALPILIEHGIRANQNIIPSSIDTGFPPMSVYLQDIFGQCTKEQLQTIPHLDLHFKSKDTLEISCLKFASYFKKLSIKNQHNIFNEIISSLDPIKYKYSRMMTVEDINKFQDCVDFGIHSFEHASMPFNNFEYFKEDISKCLEWSKNNLNELPTIYAFPNGFANAEHVEYLKKNGFTKILLVGEDKQSDNTLINRFTMYGNSIDELKYRFLR